MKLRIRSHKNDMKPGMSMEITIGTYIRDKSRAIDDQLFRLRRVISTLLKI